MLSNIHHERKANPKSSEVSPHRAGQHGPLTRRGDSPSIPGVVGGGGGENGCSHSEKSMEVLCKTRHRYRIQELHSCAGTQREASSEMTFPPHFLSTAIENTQDTESTRLSTPRKTKTSWHNYSLGHYSAVKQTHGE